MPGGSRGWLTLVVSDTPGKGAIYFRRAGSVRGDTLTASAGPLPMFKTQITVGSPFRGQGWRLALPSGR
jgi:hypothetical protein